MRRACALTLVCLLLVGCITRGRNQSPNPTRGAGAMIAVTAPAPSPFLVVGRIISIDVQRQKVIIELGAFVELPSDFATRSLLARTDALRPTARLQSSDYLRGRILGTRLLAGTPQVGDEVGYTPTGQ